MKKKIFFPHLNIVNIVVKLKKMLKSFQRQFGEIMQAHRRHNISDHTWKILKPQLLGDKGHVGRPFKDNCLFINSMIDGLSVQTLLAARGYDTDEIIETVVNA